jgi:nitrate/nitrite transport system substrate-binding protein
MASAFRDHLNPDHSLSTGCSCGRHASQSEHDRSVSLNDPEGLAARLVETAVVKAVFGADATRRAFLRTIGSGTALAALSQVFPLAAAREALAQAPGPIEKKDLKIGSSPSPAPRRSSWRTRWASTPRTVSIPKSSAPPAGR